MNNSCSYCSTANQSPKALETPAALLAFEEYYYNWKASLIDSTSTGPILQHKYWAHLDILMFPHHGPIELLNFVIGIPLNIFLLYLIRRFSRKELGSYKHLLTIFALHDIFLSLVEAILNVAAVRVGTVVSVVARTFWESRHITCAYVAIYFLPFLLTNLNFLYRYWAIKSPGRLALYSCKCFQCLLISVIAAVCASWYLALLFFCDGESTEPETIILIAFYKERFGMTIDGGWVVMDYWPGGNFALRPFLVLLFTDTLMLISFITAVSLSTMTFYHIHINTMVSEAFKKYQRKVLIACCAQTIVPVICVYPPYASVLNTPFFQVDDFVAPENAASLLTSFPLWDAVVIITLMRDYRVGALNILFGNKWKRKEVAPSMFTTTHGTPTQTF